MVKVIARRLAILLVALVALAGVGVVVAAPAQASVGNCATEQFCLYENASFGGAWTYTSWESTSGACHNLGSFGNQASSVRNAAYTHAIDLYVATNCTGSPLTVKAGNQYYFGPPSSLYYWNDNVESWHWRQ